MSFRTAFGAQLRRDLAEWWPLWAAAVAAGLVPLLLPVIYAARGEEALDLRLAALVVGGGLYWLASLGLLGDGLASRDLGEGRYGFYAARPAGAGAFWLARVTAAVLLVAAITASLVLPAWLAHPADAGPREPAMNPWTMPITAPGVDLTSPWAPNSLAHESGEGVLAFLAALAPLGLLGVLLSLLLVAHLAGTIGRSRDAWTLLDFGGFFLLAILLLEARDVLLSAHAFAAMVAAERLVVAATGAILLLAGWRQLVRGRVDLVRGHGAFSRLAWPLLVLGAVVLLGIANWVAHPRPSDLRSAEQVRTTADGRHALVTGRMAHRLGLRSGVVFSEGEATTVSGSIHAVAAADRADRLAWSHCRRLQALDCEIWTWSPDRQEARPTGIFSNWWDHRLAWSPHGQLLALVQDRVEVWQPAWTADGDSETAVPRLLYARDPGDGYALEPAFLSARRLRYLTVNADVDFVRVEEIDLPSRSVRTLGDLPGEAPLQIVSSPSGRYVAAMSLIPSYTSVLDAESGGIRELQTHPLMTDWFLTSIRFVGDRSLYLLASDTTDAEVGDWRLVRVDLDSLWGEEPAAAFTETPLPSVGSQAHLGVRDGALLLSGHTGETEGEAGGEGSRPRLTLPDGVEPLPGHGIWEMSPEGAWHHLADGVRLLYEPMRLAPQRDNSTLIAGDGTVLRWSEDGPGEESLAVVVPALPETGAGWPRRF